MNTLAKTLVLATLSLGFATQAHAQHYSWDNAQKRAPRNFRQQPLQTAPLRYQHQPQPWQQAQPQVQPCWNQPCHTAPPAPVVGHCGNGPMVNAGVPRNRRPNLTGYVYVNGRPVVTGGIQYGGRPVVTGGIQYGGRPMVTGGMQYEGRPMVTGGMQYRGGGRHRGNVRLSNRDLNVNLGWTDRGIDRAQLNLRFGR